MMVSLNVSLPYSYVKDGLVDHCILQVSIYKHYVNQDMREGLKDHYNFGYEKKGKKKE